MSRKPDPARIAEAARLYHSAGLTESEVARALLVNEKTVRRWLAGTTRRTGPRSRPDVDDDLILRLRQQEGLSYDEIGRRVHMSTTGVRMRYYALTGRPRADRIKTPDQNGATGEPQ